MKILVAGDYSPRQKIASLLRNSDFSFFNEVIQYTALADYSIVNFESCVASETDVPIKKTGPNLQCDGKAIDSIKFAGFDCVTLANNHFYDYGDVGVANTLRLCNEKSIDYVGGGRNLQEAEAIFYKQIGGKTLGIINVCENEWSIATNDHGGSAPLNPVKNYYTIQEAKHNADYVLLIVHGGVEMYSYPTPRMIDTYRFFVDAGADAVVNHHQHCYSGYEWYQGKPIFYGIGNFCFDWLGGGKSWEEGYVVLIDFENNKIKTDIYPYSQFGDNANVCFFTDCSGFNKNIDDINGVIANRTKLDELFSDMARSRYGIWDIEPYYGRLARKLYFMKILPSLCKSKKRWDILDLLLCESHYEKTIEKLKSCCGL